MEEYLSLTDESVIYDVLRHPAVRNRGGLAVSSLTSEETERLKAASDLLRRVTSGRKSGDIYRTISTASFNHSRDIQNLRDICSPELVARLSRGRINADDIVLDCESTDETDRYAFR